MVIFRTMSDTRGSKKSKMAVNKLIVKYFLFGWLPSWIFHFRSRLKLFGVSPSEFPTQKTCFFHFEFPYYLVYKLSISRAYFQFERPPYWTLTSGYIKQCSTQLTYFEDWLEYLIVVLQISLLSCPQAEIRKGEVATTPQCSRAHGNSLEIWGLTKGIIDDMSRWRHLFFFRLWKPFWITQW